MVCRGVDNWITLSDYYFSKCTMIKLNLGCGDKIKRGFINIDSQKLKGVDIIHDLNKYPYPFQEGSIDYILCDNILEHLNDIVDPLDELWRVSKDKAEIDIIVPLFPGVYSMIDPTHKSFYTFMTFDYFLETHSLEYYSKSRFKMLNRKIRFHPLLKFMNPIINSHERIQKFYYIFLSGIIPPMFLEVKLEVLKK